MSTTRTKSSTSTFYSSVFSVGLLVFLSMSCESALYDQTIQIEKETWKTNKAIPFEFDILDTLSQYNIFLEIVHRPWFNYQNIYCKVESYSPLGLAQKQINPLELASKKGYWLGECTEEKCIRKIPFITRSKFNLPGKYKIILHQYSRLDSLEGILSLRLIIDQIHS